MKYLLYFAVTCYNDYIYITEKNMAGNPKDTSRLIDLVDDYKDLKDELNWNQLNEEHKPDVAGCYQAVVQHRQTAEDDYSLDVISCTPMCVL